MSPNTEALRALVNSNPTGPTNSAHHPTPKSSAEQEGPNAANDLNVLHKNKNHKQDDDDALRTPTMKELAVSHKSLKDRSNALKRGCTLDIDAHYPLIRQVCSDSLNSVSFLMEDEALILLGDLHQQNSNSNNSSSMLTPWHAFWAQRRCHMYLDAVQKVMDHAPVAALQLEMAGCCCHNTSCTTNNMSMCEDYNGSSNKVTISPWRLPHLVFDVMVGAADLYSTVRTPQPGQCSPPSVLLADNGAKRKKKNRSGLSGFYSQEAGNPNDASSDHLPISVQVRAVSEVYLLGEQQPVSSNRRVLPDCKIDIIRVVHKGVTASAGAHAGDVALLLSLAPIQGLSVEQASPLRVKEARMMQINAIPPQHNACVDLYTSTSMEDESEITIALRFLTKRCQNEAPPQLIIDLIVDY
mmetsp:Transcript_28217/g.43908  ORF Transcript_28217/g.43908 Transcript_28217/m.43908 type:complete len:411 (+) Transcript_28217:478-1710(+)|eukprot:CAMPEP_0196817884 /NCGR_PEP_ID=MMETSP1362-20130617/63036_1 /TAXON_ID=163516 /ORGANISM="Leptocylindrus danicus, Strain CCMP1856" /LENGTH=410 /DNA_ID=CAMNT_0042195763 /DNA_START=412 /DNA_END=1644 /DNA_ORIENTATION=-